jgi:hypothetical protein
MLTAFLGVLMIATSGSAQACPSEKPLAANEPRPILMVTHKLKTDVKVVGVTSVSFLSKIDATRGAKGCCGGAHHTNGAGCASGCCFACSAALSGMIKTTAIEDHAGSYALSRQSLLNFTSPDSQFRPPRQLV